MSRTAIGYVYTAKTIVRVYQNENNILFSPYRVYFHGHETRLVTESVCWNINFAMTLFAQRSFPPREHRHCLAKVIKDAAAISELVSRRATESSHCPSAMPLGPAVLFAFINRPSHTRNVRYWDQVFPPLLPLVPVVGSCSRFELHFRVPNYIHIGCR